MSKKNWHPANTGDELIALAKSHGAVVEDAHTRKSQHTKITTRNGSTFVAPGDEVLDKKTLSNIKKWFRLLGLMIVLLPFLANYVAGLLGFQINWF